MLQHREAMFGSCSRRESEPRRRGLQRATARGKATRRNGVPLLQSPTPPRPVTAELVNRLRDEAP